MMGFSAENKQDLFPEVMISEALKKSKIEGEIFQSRICDVLTGSQFGIKDYLQNNWNKMANAIAHLMIEVQNSYHKPIFRKNTFGLATYCNGK